MIKRLLTKPVTWLAIVLFAAGGAAGLHWFQPWRLFTSSTVMDQLSAAAPAAPAPASPAASGKGMKPSMGMTPAQGGMPSAGAAKASTAPATGPVLVRQGTFVTHEHETTGMARLIRTVDGGHQLELAGLITSDGPDLRVWLTDQEVKTGVSAWKVFDDGRHLELGRLKGNRGDQVYRLPEGADPADYRSITIWCARFSVSFGAAALV
ncbi:DM13 domain-containing protein [Actinoplanes sp. NPDC051859]|uniref:DM13 domain-containing protein n=1 Tax=Actinoplanes sp. NPDC051859 TaxID=3363909 RepID=UPI003791EC98